MGTLDRPFSRYRTLFEKPKQKKDRNNSK